MIKATDKNMEQIARFNKQSNKANDKISSIKPTGTKPLLRSKEQEKKQNTKKNSLPAGRKKIPSSEKRKHGVTIYLTDNELKYLSKIASQHFIGNAKMLRVLIDENKILQKDSK